MFEKEAEEYLKKLLKRLKIKEKDLAENQPEILSWEKMNFVSLDVSNVSEAFQKGAEFGYNKANEWHYMKDGDLPNTELGRVDVTIAYINAYKNLCKMDCCFDGTNFIYWNDRRPIGWKKADIFGKIYAWKYLEKLPELPKESEQK